MRDTIMMGSIAGFVATTVMTFYHWVIERIGLRPIQPWETAANIFLNPSLIHKPIGYFIGFLGQYVLGSIFGVAVAYTLKLTGKDYYWVKVIGVGALVWLGSLGLFMKMLGLKLEGRSDPLTNWVTVIDFVVFGSICSLIIAHYARFKSKT